MNPLPSLRRKILRSFSVVVVLYATFGVILVGSELVANGTRNISGTVLIWMLIYFAVTLVISLFVADGLASRLSRPLKSITEALQRRPEAGRRLNLVEPTSLELFILTTELKRLWNKVIEAQQVNVSEIIQQKQKLETVLEAVDDALLVIESDGRVSHCNHFLSTLVGLPIEKIQGQIWADLSTNQSNYLKLRETIQPELLDTLELELTVKNEKRHFAARTRSIFDSSGKPIATVYLIHDVTHQKNRGQFQGEFVELLLHELNTPLQSLRRASEFLVGNRAELSENNLSLAQTLFDETERVRAVINDFLHVSQSQSKIMRFRLDRIELKKVIPEWIRPFKVLAKDREINLKFRSEGSDTIWSNIDTVKFPWVVSNLLSNAIRFSPVKGTVEIFLTDRNGYVEIRVTDEGSGISEEEQKRMFEPFWHRQALGHQVTNTGRRWIYGMGLSIAKDVVEAHEGQIEYFRRQPKGSEFRILLPFPK